MIIKYTDIHQVHIELTQRCQASCPMCDRNKNGGEVNQHLSNADLSLNDVKRIFPVDLVRQLKNIYFCGNHGDPIFAPDCLDIVSWFREINPGLYISLNTNGGARGPVWWEELAGVIDYVTFSVDGLEDTNHLYRQGVSWDKVEENMEAFCDAGGKAKWEFLIFGHNEHQIEEARGIASMLGLDKFIVKKSGRYVSTATLKKKEVHQAIDRRGNELQLLSKPSLPEYQNKADDIYDIITTDFGNMDNYLDVATIDCKAIKKREIYVSAEGYVFPCCWTAGQMYKWWHKPGEAQVWEHINKVGIDNINAKIVSIKHIISEFFVSISESWDIDGCDNGKLKVCALKCNKRYDPFAEQWK